MKNLIFTKLLFLTILGSLYGQTEKSPVWSVEIGASYGQLYSNVVYDKMSLDTTIHRSWTKFRPMPVFKVTRSFETKGIINSTIQPFISFSVIGTETDWEETLLGSNSPNVPFFINAEAYTYYYIPSIEVGSFWNFAIQDFEIGLGIKGQTHLKLWTNDHYLNVQTTSEPFVFNSENVFFTRKTMYRLLSANFGGKVQYNFNRFLIAIEGWYGFTNLSKLDLNGLEYREMETNFRLMVGYKF